MLLQYSKTGKTGGRTWSHWLRFSQKKVFYRLFREFTRQRSVDFLLAGKMLQIKALLNGRRKFLSEFLNFLFLKSIHNKCYDLTWGL